MHNDLSIGSSGTKWTYLAISNCLSLNGIKLFMPKYVEDLPVYEFYESLSLVFRSTEPLTSIKIIYFIAH